MGKKEKSEKHGTSWLGTPGKLRPGARISNYDPSDTLRDPDFVRKGIIEAIEAGDSDGAVDILRGHLRVLNRSKAAMRMEIGRQHVHRIIAGTRQPSLEVLASFMRMLKGEQSGYRNPGAGK